VIECHSSSSNARENAAFSNKDSLCYKTLNSLPIDELGRWSSMRRRYPWQPSGLKIMAGQRTMSGLIMDLTGQTPVIFGYKHFIFHTVVA